MSTKRASENRFPLVRIVLDGDSPGLPPAGELHIRADDDGILYTIDPDGTVVELGSVGTHSHSGADITSGTVADARIASTIARDSELPDLAAHLGDTSDAHDASAVSIADAGNYFTGTDVEAALQELGAGGGGGGGGASVTEYGYATLGATDETMTQNRVYLKQITAANDGMALGIRIYTKETTDSVGSIWAAIYEDVAGAPGNLIGHGRGPIIAMTNNSSFASSFRWLAIPVGPVPLVSGTSYWVAWMVVPDLSGSPQFVVKYDAGSDQKWDSGGTFMTDKGRYTISSTSRKYTVVLEALDL